MSTVLRAGDVLGSGQAMLELRDVTVRHIAAPNGAASLRSINLRIEAGEQLAIIGPSGAGKTTLLHTLALALQPSEGEVELMGKDAWKLSHRQRHTLRRQLFLAPQTPPLPDRQRVVTAVLAGRLPMWSLWQAIRNLIKPVDPGLAWRALSRFQLQDKLYARVDRLSGGERQRCALARMLVSEARLLIVDEPLSALDPNLAHQTLQVLQQEASATGATLICSLHQVDLALAHFRRVIGLRDGQILFDTADGTHVTETMIATLYENRGNATTTGPQSLMNDDVATIPEPVRCF